MTTQTKPKTYENEIGFSEAPASWITRYVHPSGFECQITLRGDTGAELLEKVQKAIEYLLENECQPYSFNRYGGSSKANNHTEKTSQGDNGNRNGQSWCPIHHCEVRRWEKDGRVWSPLTNSTVSGAKGRHKNVKNRLTNAYRYALYGLRTAPARRIF